MNRDNYFKTAAHTFNQDLQLDIVCHNGGLTVVFSREPRLYKRVCLSVGWSVGPSVGQPVGSSVRP